MNGEKEELNSVKYIQHEGRTPKREGGGGPVNRGKRTSKVGALVLQWST